jgi:hypothetical protein
MCVANENFAGRNWKNVRGLVVLALLAGANGLFHLEATEIIETGDLAIRLSIAVMVLLVAFIGGRVVPSFTRNWFRKNDGPEIAGPMVGSTVLTWRFPSWHPPAGLLWAKNRLSAQDLPLPGCSACTLARLGDDGGGPRDDPACRLSLAGGWADPPRCIDAAGCDDHCGGAAHADAGCDGHHDACRHDPDDPRPYGARSACRAGDDGDFYVCDRRDGSVVAYAFAPTVDLIWASAGF